MDYLVTFFALDISEYSDSTFSVLFNSFCLALAAVWLMTLHGSNSRPGPKNKAGVRLGNFQSLAKDAKLLIWVQILLMTLVPVSVFTVTLPGKPSLYVCSAVVCCVSAEDHRAAVPSLWDSFNQPAGFDCCGKCL